MKHHRDNQDLWSVQGQFEHLVYSPRGDIEGVIITTSGILTQFVFDKHDDAAAARFQHLKAGQPLEVEGRVAEPSPKGEASHHVYHFERLASVGGQPSSEEGSGTRLHGRVARLNYARHGAPNGAVLESGDFIHTKPSGFARVPIRVGDEIDASGPVKPLRDGRGVVMEAERVNGVELRG